jgi:hypothetical protein
MTQFCMLLSLIAAAVTLSRSLISEAIAGDAYIFRGSCQTFILANLWNDSRKCEGYLTRNEPSNGTVWTNFSLRDATGISTFAFQGLLSEEKEGTTSDHAYSVRSVVSTVYPPCHGDNDKCLGAAMKAGKSAKTMPVKSGVCTYTTNGKSKWQMLVICTAGPDNAFVAVFETDGKAPITQKMP